MKSKKSRDEAKTLIQKTEEVLKKINMKIKGWCISGEDPPDEISEDTKSIQFSGMTWFPRIDSFKLNIASLHFGKKVRGKTSSKLDIYDIEKHGSIGEFLKNKVNSILALGAFFKLNTYQTFARYLQITILSKHD